MELGKFEYYLDELVKLIQDIINKTDSMSTLYIGDDHPDLPKLQEQLKTL